MAPQPVNPWHVVYGPRAAHLRATPLPHQDTRLLIAALRAWRNETYSSAPPADQRTANLIVTLTRTLPRTVTTTDTTPGLWTLTRALRALHTPPRGAPRRTLPLPELDWEPVTPGAHQGTYARLTGDSTSPVWYHLDEHSAATLDLNERGSTLEAHLRLHATPSRPIPLHAQRAVQEALSAQYPHMLTITTTLTVTPHREGLSVSLHDFLTELRRQLH